MKIAFFLFFICLFCANVAGFSQTRISINAANVSVRNVIREIESKSDYTFFYNEDFTDIEKIISYTANNELVVDVLKNIAKKTGLNFNVLGNKLVVVTKEIQVKQKITGKVTNEKAEPIPEVSISIKGTTIGTTSDVNGNYSLVIPDNDKTLVFSFIGMLTQEVSINKQAVLNIVLEESAIGLEEVIVIGYGTRARKDVTTSISTITKDAVSKSSGMSSELSMQGRMTGVQVTSGGGNPMARPTIRVRGVNTWGIYSPLYIIDGIPVIEFGAGIEGLDDARAGNLRGPLNIMTMINPNDIESISVLKDASAASVYGVRAANGVILITTKKGSGDKPVVEFSTRLGVQNITQKTDVMNPAQYTSFINKVLASDPTIAIDPDNVGRFDPSSPNYLGNSDTYDWYKALKNKNAFSKDYSVRISGGIAKTDYFMSFGSTSTEGTIKNNSLDRLSGTFKINTQINSWLKVGANYRIASGKGREMAHSDLVEAGQFPAWQKVYDHNGLNGYAPAVVGRLANGTYSSEKLYGDGTRTNPLGVAAASDKLYKSMRNMGSAYIEFEPVRNLKIKTQSSMDIYSYELNEFNDYDGSVFDYTVGDLSAPTNGNSVGSYSEREVYNYNFINEINLSYTKTYRKHNFDLVLNGSDQQYNAKYKITSTQWVQSKTNYMLGGDPKYTNVESSYANSALEGIMGRTSYNFNSIYYLDVTVRRDGSTRFSGKDRWGTFPSFSAAWRISREAFLKDVSFITDLKIRAGYGKLGNQEVRDMAFLSPIDNRPVFAWGNDPGNPGMGIRGFGAAVYSIPNADLQWEKTTTTNIGFDAMLLENNVMLSFDYFNKLTSGILQTVTLPLSAGLIQMPVDNIATVRNTGIELSLNYNNSIGEFKYNIDANFSTVKNTVEKTSGNIPIGSMPSGIIEEGYSINYIKGYRAGGIFQSQAELDAWMAKYSDASYQNAKIAPGDYYFLDQRSPPTVPNTFYKDSLDSRINSYDQVYLGKTIPGYYYGFNLGMEYKNLDLNLHFIGVGDVQKINYVKMLLYDVGTTKTNESIDVLNAWTPENKSTTLPRAVNGDPAGNYRFSDRFVESAAYFRLSNIQIGYSLPTQVYSFMRNTVSNLRVYAGGSNIFTLTQYTGYDPENDNYPTPRTFFVGLNVRF